MMRKLVALLLALVMCVTCFAFAGCTEKTPNELKKIKVAHHMGYSGAAAVAVGTKMGYFVEEGLDVELVPFTSGPTEIAAMVSGELQFGYIGSGATNLAVKGDVEIMYFQNLGDSEVIVVNKDSGIKSMADLKGKTLATTFGTSGENVVNLALAKAGLTSGDKADQVNVINMDMGGCVTAMVAGKVDAVCVWGSYLVTVRGQLGDKFLELARTSDFADEYSSCSSWLTTQKYMDENPETVQAFANALAKSFDYWKANKTQVAAWVAEIVDADVKNIEDQIGEVYFFNSKELDEKLKDGTIRKYYELQQKSMLKDKKITKEVPIDEYVHWNFMEEAIKNAAK